MPATLPFSLPITPDLVHGALELEATPGGILPHRLPARARAQCRDPQLAMVEAQPSGVRLVFESTATRIELVTLPTKRVYRGMPPRPDGVVDLLVDGVLASQASAPGGRTLAIDLALGTVTEQAGAPQVLRFDGLPARMKRIELWLPHDETTELVGLHADAPLQVAAPGGRRRWLHHGSSISQGSNATSPTGIWPAVAAARADVELVNLGYGGSAVLDPFVARTMRDLPADIISIKIGINLVNLDLMRQRAFGPALHGFLDTIREGHPHTPLFVVSPIHCPMHEDVPGPTLFDTAAMRAGTIRFRATGSASEVRQGKLALDVVRHLMRELVQARAAADAHLRYVDGNALYGPDDAERLPLPDALHPDARAHRLIGERFADLVLAPAPRRRG